MTKSRRPPLFGSHEGRQGRFLIGTLRVRADGSGTLRPVAGPPDLFVSRDEAAKALDGDLVRVEVIQTQSQSTKSRREGRARANAFHGRDSARVVEVIEQRRRFLIGTLDKRGPVAFVVARDKRLSAPFFVRGAARLRHGDLVKVALTEGSEHGSVIERLDPDDARSVMLESAYAQGFSDVFPKAALREAEELPEGIPAEERGRRLDLTRLPLVTIDGEDARDFDDAVFVEALPKGAFRLVVAIADVAHFVPRGSAIDLEAIRRATSVYFPSLVLPMLPERLSNGLCSLNPNEERLCLAADMIFRPKGRGESLHLASASFHEAILKSAARCTYTDIDAFLDGKSVRYLTPLERQIGDMAALAQKLIQTRQARGALDLDLPEARVLVDDKGQPKAIEPRGRTFANRIVEEFMLAANEAVAAYFEEGALPTIFRVHAEPDARKLAQCLQLAHVYGVGLELKVDPKSKKHATLSNLDVCALAKSIEGHPAARSLHFQILRALAQAFYTPDNAGHFGLASPAYLHFTSPIRRYPDLEVHRQLKAALSAEKSKKKARRSSLQKLEEKLDAIAGRSSERERAALAAERDVQAWAAASLMKERVGERFHGVIGSVTDFGVFVTLDEVHVEGLIKADRLGSPRVELDPECQRVRLGGGKKALMLGSKVEVEVERVDVAHRHIDLGLVGVLKG
ncbi:MAG: VacB/RNase II family 3'-5' exoribonuclease [Myxococcales bacterium]|jgi:ribonuclease R|nr:VacB/RNase II family 3'-5' exoribonuclease [Myxococcales bacterium]